MFFLVVRAEAFGNDIVQLPDFIPSRDRLVAIYAFQFRAQKRKISFSENSLGEVRHYQLVIRGGCLPASVDMRNPL